MISDMNFDSGRSCAVSIASSVCEDYHVVQPSAHFYSLRMRFTVIVALEEGVVHASKRVVLRMRHTRPNCPGNVCEKDGNYASLVTRLLFPGGEKRSRND